MPCRSSRASISLRPRESCERSRRPSGASGGGSDLGAAQLSAASQAVLARQPVAARHWFPPRRKATGGFAARCRLRSGLTCLATLSHSARSSSLRPRLRRGSGVSSGIEFEDRRFMGGCDIGGGGGGGRSSGTGSILGRASGSGTGFAMAAWRGRRLRGRRPLAAAPGPRPASRRSSGLLADPSADRPAETVLRFSPTAARPAPASCGPAPTGSRLFGTSMTKRMLWRRRPDTLPASAPAPK